MLKEAKLPITWDDELTDKEVYCLGKIVAHWGAIEHEIFLQTLMTFNDTGSEGAELPPAMSNIRFSNVLELWEQRVVKEESGQRRGVLEEQLKEIKALKDMRNALVHSMLYWSPKDIGVIEALRIRHKQYITVKFTSDDLADFCLRLGQINFGIRFPGGAKELAARREGEGGGISRKGFAIFSGHKILSEWRGLSEIHSDSEDK